MNPRRKLVKFLTL